MAKITKDTLEVINNADHMIKEMLDNKITDEEMLDLIEELKELEYLLGSQEGEE